VDDWETLLERQAGVLTRVQALAFGVSAVQFARAVRRGELVHVHPRVYVGAQRALELERAWAAVLWAEPAGLCGISAMRAFSRRDLTAQDDEPIHVLVDRHRGLDAPAGVILHRSAHTKERIQDNLSPPRVRYEHTVLDVAETATDDLKAIAALADACGSRRTTAARLLATLETRPWARRRAWLQGILGDVAQGTCSALEHGCLTLVERPHGLPSGRRQASAQFPGRSMWRDVHYEDWCFLVELDGRLGHTATRDRDRDLDRDLDAAVVQAHHRPTRVWTGLRDRVSDSGQAGRGPRSTRLARSCDTLPRVWCSR
jgi:hypothetical protein